MLPCMGPMISGANSTEKVQLPPGATVLQVLSVLKTPDILLKIRIQWMVRGAVPWLDIFTSEDPDSPRRTLPKSTLRGSTAIWGTEPVPLWLTEKLFPAMVTAAVLAAEPGLAATVYRTAPFPLPLAPEVRVIQDAWLTAVQAHPDPAVTFTSSPPPAEEKALSPGERA